MAKKRADVLLYEKGLASSREKAKRVIMSGSVYIGSRRIDKPGENVDEEDEIYIKNNPLKYVSRGGLKLDKAIEHFDLNLKDAVCMDIGASTGGFTDCMLQNEKVLVMDRTNIRNVGFADIGEYLDFISIDVSFISLSLVLPVAKSLLKADGKIVALIKPQFEAGRVKVGKKGIVRDKETHFEVIKKVMEIGINLDLKASALTFSPVTGAKGNIEYLILLEYCYDDNNSIEEELIYEVIKKASTVL